ncbi:MAG: glycosyltransferase [Gammaproteobacteria bacterium]
MRVLFVHQNFPGQFKHLAPWLISQGHQVVGMGDAENLGARAQGFGFPVVAYKGRKEGSASTHHYLRSFEGAVRRGQDAARACMDLRAKGFVPDLVIGHPAWGEMLFVRDVFPDARLVPYFEFFYRAVGADVGFDPEYPSTLDTGFKLRIRNSTQLHALSEANAGISPTAWQRSTYPEREKPRIHVIHEGLDLDVVRPDPAARFRLPDGRVLGPDEQVVTFVSRQLEPYRGFHVFMRALPELQRRLPRAQFVIVGSDGVSYGTPPPKPHACYREMLLAEVGPQLDAARTHFVGRLAYGDYLALMQLSRLHIYLSYPFVLSWSMLEAMACGAPVLGSATPPVQEMIRDGENGWLFDFFDREALVAKAVEILASDTQAVRAAARAMVESRFSFREHSLPAYLALIRELLPGAA